MLISLAPLLLLFAFYGWMFRRQQGAIGGLLGGAKQKRVDPETVRVTFNDVAGIDEVEAEINEIVDFLKDPEKYRRVGARAPKGVLLAGAPGTGKTLLARATAGEARVPFFSASASEFIEMIVGVGASRVRELFAEARKVAPAIIFIDEIDDRSHTRRCSRVRRSRRARADAEPDSHRDGRLFRPRGRGGSCGHESTRRSGFRPLRPGRFDRQIIIHPPDFKGRVEILKVHTRRIPLANDVDLERLAATPGMTGADLANACQRGRAARRSPQTGRRASTRSHGCAREGPIGHRSERRDSRGGTPPHRVPRSRPRTARHAAARADPVRKVSIVPRGRTLGVTLSTPNRIAMAMTPTTFEAGSLALGGMAAEQKSSTSSRPVPRMISKW